MNLIETELAGVVILEPKIFGDERGFFMETYQKQHFAELGIDVDFVQDNHSKSKRGILRGLHYQLENTQGKLCRVVQGEVFDVAVDIRRSSPTFGKYASVILSDENRRQFYVPPGFAHGFCVLSETAEFLYKCTDYYAPHAERTLMWNDPTVGIDWPIDDPVLSQKDQEGQMLDEADCFD